MKRPVPPPRKTQRKRAARLLPLALAVSLMAAATPPGAEPTSADGWYAAGQQAYRAGHYPDAARAFTRAVALNPSAANWRWLGEASLRAGRLETASAAFDQAIARYRRLGDAVTASALDHRAAPLRQTAEVDLLDAPAPAGEGAACHPAPARLEPPGGLLLGRYVGEDGLSRPASGAPTLTLPAPGAAAFAVYFRYFTLTAPGGGEVFPTRFIAAVRAAGGAAHLAMEPKVPLAQVTEALMRPFAQAARASGVPIFLRFAGEMNDRANPWSADPAAYRAAFARVAAVMHRLAPNVAMVWMPMATNLDGIAAYYPGRDAVDWAGLSLYSVPYENGELDRPNAAVHPTDQIEDFYRRYACTHPIQLSEYAASHRTLADPGRDFTPFAVQQMRETYWGAMLHFPRLKNINWLDLDMTTQPGIGKPLARRNDYRLSAVPAKLEVLGSLLGEGYFRVRVSAPGAPPSPTPPSLTPPAAQPWPASVAAPGTLRGAVWVKTAAPVRTLAVTLDGQPVPVEATLPYRFTLEHARLPPGTHTLVVTVQTAPAAGTPGSTAASTRIVRTQTFQVR